MSTRTPNLNLEKPGSDENYSISVFNSNADTIDTEVALRVKTADIINNLTSTATNKPLSAAQGKALSDTIATKESHSNLEMKFNQHWDTFIDKVPHTYHYEGVSASEYNLPTQYCEVTVQFYNANRATAMATRWQGGNPETWVISKQDTWGSWQKLATFEQGTWTAHIYDYETKKFEVSGQRYWKIGSIVIAKIYIDSFPNTTFADMLQIRNVPFNTVIGGNIYSAWVGGNLGDRTFQETAGRVYVRPNFTGTIGGGVFSAMIIGFDV